MCVANIVSQNSWGISFGSWRDLLTARKAGKIQREECYSLIFGFCIM